jgi:hypothetical protein
MAAAAGLRLGESSNLQILGDFVSTLAAFWRFYPICRLMEHNLTGFLFD